MSANSAGLRAAIVCVKVKVKWFKDVVMTTVTCRTSDNLKCVRCNALGTVPVAPTVGTMLTRGPSGLVVAAGDINDLLIAPTCDTGIGGTSISAPVVASVVASLGAT